MLMLLDGVVLSHFAPKEMKTMWLGYPEDKVTGEVEEKKKRSGEKKGRKRRRRKKKREDDNLN